MPLYTDQYVNEDGAPGEVFELFQGMNDPKFTHHPETGRPVCRLISAPHISGQYSTSAMKSSVNDNQKLEHLGFTKYERRGKGILERTAGTKGPKIISAD